MATNETNGISLRRLKTFLTNLKNIFAEKSHSHATSDIIGLDTALSNKATSAQGNKADTAVQSVKIGTTEYKFGTTVTLPSYPTSLPASDVPSWAKQKTKPTYTASEIGLGNVGNFKAVSTLESQGLTDTEKSNARVNIGAQVAGSYASSTHNHTKSQITDFPTSMPANGGNATTVNGHTVNVDVPSGAKFTDTNTWRPQPDWNATSGDAVIKNKPSLAKVATSGSYNDLSNKPIIPTIPSSLPANGGTSNNTNFINIVAGNEIRFNKNNYSPSDLFFGYCWSDGSKSPLLNNYIFGNMNGGGLANIKANEFIGSVAWNNITGRPSSLPASDVYSWAKASSKPSYTASEVGAAPTNHSHNNYLTGINKTMVVNALGYTPPTTNTTYNVATQSANGLFSASDKKKLDGITSGSNTIMKLISSTDYSKLSDAQKKNGTVYFVV